MSEIRVGQHVRHVAYGFTGMVTSIQLKRVLSVVNGDLHFDATVMATIRIEVAGMYGEYADFRIAELTEA